MIREQQQTLVFTIGRRLKSSSRLGDSNSTAHLFQIVQPVDMAVRGQINADAAAVQAFGACTQLQQSLDILGLQLR
jgi:hypothetical protein